MNIFRQYHKRYNDQKAELQVLAGTDDMLVMIESHSVALNNLFMAGMGMATLFLRFGAVIQMRQKLTTGDLEQDALFIKQVMDNLRETLPSDTNWKNLWYASLEPRSSWDQALPRNKHKQTALDRFVTFRNKYVHQHLRLIPEHADQLNNGLATLDELAQLLGLFDEGEMVFENGHYCWQTSAGTLDLHPFVQPGMEQECPYVFQGLYDNKLKAKFVNAMHGDETLPAVNQGLNNTFEPMMQALQGGAGQVFDHSKRLHYYLECFVGRERELSAVLEWVEDKTAPAFLPIYSEAGMGKGALCAGIIDALKEAEVPTMYHFCGSGLANNLQSVLYHFILQGQRMPHLHGASVWEVADEKVQGKLDRLPSRYTDVIQLFQFMLDHCYAPPKKSAEKPLVILIDGLDEAAVVHSQLSISDWLNTYKDDGEVAGDWKSPPFVKWIFTYRSLQDQEKGYSLGLRSPVHENSLLQPLSGLSDQAVREALCDFEVSEEFIATAMERGSAEQRTLLAEVCSTIDND